MVNRLIGHLGKPPLVVHRLDMDTSGLLLFAKTSAAADSIARQFRNRTVSKTYLAICLGVPPEASFEVHADIGPHPNESVARMTRDRQDDPPVRTGGGGGSEGEEERDEDSCRQEEGRDRQDSTAGEDFKTAWTSCRVLASNPEIDITDHSRPGVISLIAFQAGLHRSHGCASPLWLITLFYCLGLLFRSPATDRGAMDSSLQGVSLIECRPHTGRTHQIRVHCQHAGVSQV